MAKKLFVSKSRLVKGSRRYIDFTRIDVETGIETRHRQDFGLNDIEDETIREGVADVLVKNLETFTRYDQNQGAGRCHGEETRGFCHRAETNEQAEEYPAQLYHHSNGFSKVGRSIALCRATVSLRRRPSCGVADAY